jgi:hypothetical protein
LAPELLTQLLSPCPPTCGCDDLNLPPDDWFKPGLRDGMTVAAARRIRRLVDPETAAIAASSVLLQAPNPADLAGIHIDGEATTIRTSSRQSVAVPEHAQGLLRNRANRPLVPREWATDVAATYLTLRLEDAERHINMPLLDPARLLPPLIAWHERPDPGAQTLAHLTRSAWVAARTRKP